MLLGFCKPWRFCFLCHPVVSHVASNSRDPTKFDANPRKLQNQMLMRLRISRSRDPNLVVMVVIDAQIVTGEDWQWEVDPISSTSATGLHTCTCSLMQITTIALQRRKSVPGTGFAEARR